MHFFFQPWSIVLQCGWTELNDIFSFSSARYIQWLGFSLIRISWHCVIDIVFLYCVCCKMLIRTWIIVRWAVICIYQSLTYIHHLYPEWPHKQGGCLARWRLQGFKIESWLWLSCTDLYYAWEAQGVLWDQSIWSTVSDGILRSWLWSTATTSSPLGYFSRILQAVDNWPHIVVVDSPLGGSWP